MLFVNPVSAHPHRLLATPAGSPKAEAGPGTLLNLTELLLSEPCLTRISAVTSCTLWVIPKEKFQVGTGFCCQLARGGQLYVCMCCKCKGLQTGYVNVIGPPGEGNVSAPPPPPPAGNQAGPVKTSRPGQLLLARANQGHECSVIRFFPLVTAMQALFSSSSCPFRVPHNQVRLCAL